MKILFVCTGNICRSPTAEGVLRHLAQRQKLDLQVESRGTHDYHVGEPPDQRAQRHASRRGYDLSRLRARSVAAEDFARFDVIVAMDRSHLRALERACPDEHRAKLRLFVPGRDVPDPYYGGPEGFEAVLDLIEEGCARLLDEIAGTGTTS
ncbi:MAG TPA: low molecular weight protein-tyrosine-phosphatase [Burkholderiales bacterium]|nr:low molecular weight protein-tyrosine-phosphatase [Burkholderiales bacterium]